MIAFGIDPGSQKTGFGAVRSEGSRLICLGFGVIRVDGSESLVIRLRSIFERLRAELERYAPERIFVEQIFHHKSAASALVLGQARGVALLAAGLQDKPVGEITPAEVKKSIVGNGRADKHQMKHMVRALLGLEAAAAEDASDALAIAIAGATRAHFREVVMEGSAERGLELPEEWLEPKKRARRGRWRAPA